MSVLYVIAVALAICSPMLMVGGGMIYTYWPRRKKIEPVADERMRPYYDPAACWGCGSYTSETEAQRQALFRHPVFGLRPPILCSYCEELENIKREVSQQIS